MSQLQKIAGAGGGNDQDQKANTSALSEMAEKARAALDSADAELEARKAELRAALKGPARKQPEKKQSSDRSRSFFDNPRSFCSC